MALGISLLCACSSGAGPSADGAGWSATFTSSDGQGFGTEESDADGGSAVDEGASEDGGAGSGAATGGPDLPQGECGDGVVQVGEGCDDGNAIDHDLCTNMCQLAECGDGIVSEVASERCDDGNDDDDDGCDSDCSASRIVQVSTGKAHSCALSAGGSVFCWGRGAYGALGYGSLDDIGDDEVPADVGPVPLGAKATFVSAGELHSCATLEDGTVRCWGSNLLGRLGTGNWLDIGDDEDAAESQALDFGAAAVEVHAGAAHSCARLDDGDVHCWGFGGQGRLGYFENEAFGDDEPADTGPALALGGPALSLELDHHSCARVALPGGAALRCWGPNQKGQLGLGHVSTIGDTEAPESAAPVFLGLGTQVTQVSTSELTTCASLGQVIRCWGDGERSPLGHGVAEIVGDDEWPLAIGTVGTRPGEVAHQVASGSTHTCVLLDSGRVRCWGLGDRGRLGPYVIAESGVTWPGADAPSSFPGDTSNGGRAVAIDVGHDHGCVLTEAGAVRCWGSNAYGKLGYGNTEDLGDDIGEFEALPEVNFF